MATISKSGTRVTIENFNLIAEKANWALISCDEFSRASNGVSNSVWISWDRMAMFTSPNGKRKLMIDFPIYRNIVWKFKDGKTNFSEVDFRSN